MKLQINGLNDLISDLQKKTNKGILPKMDSLKKSADYLAEKIKGVAPVCDEHTKHGRDLIKAHIKIDNKSLKVIDVGLKDLGDFEDYKGLWFNQYGFHPRRSATYVEKHKMWFDKACLLYQDDVYKQIYNIVLKDLDL